MNNLCTLLYICQFSHYQYDCIISRGNLHSFVVPCPLWLLYRTNYKYKIYFPVKIQTYRHISIQYSQNYEFSYNQEMNKKSNKIFVREIKEEQTNHKQQEIETSDLQQYYWKRDKPNLKARLSKCIVCRKMCSYRCPKCSKHYCSVDHFRSHNLFCSEQFYEKQVKQCMKGIKVKDKSEKKKVMEMVKQHQENLEDILQSGKYLEEERLEELLDMLEEGKQPQLNEKEKYFFAIFTDKINHQDIEVDKNDEFMDKPFWEIQEGLSFYWQEQLEIQELQNSQNPQIITYRSLTQKRIKQFNQFHQPQPIFNYPQQLTTHLFSILHSFVTLYRAYNGEYEEFINIFLQAFNSKEYESFLKKKNITPIILINCMKMEILKTIQRQEEETLNLWITEYVPVVLKDLSKICSNKFLILQSLFRIIDSLHLKKNQENRRMDRIQKMKIKLQKKCEYLIFIILNNYSQIKEQLVQHCQQVGQYQCSVPRQQKNENKNDIIILPLKND